MFLQVLSNALFNNCCLLLQVVQSPNFQCLRQFEKDNCVSFRSWKSKYFHDLTILLPSQKSAIIYAFVSYFHIAGFFLIYQNTMLKIKCKLTVSGTCQRDIKVSSGCKQKDNEKNGRLSVGMGLRGGTSDASVVVWLSMTSSVIIRMRQVSRMLISFTVSLIQDV